MLQWPDNDFKIVIVWTGFHIGIYKSLTLEGNRK